MPSKAWHTCPNGSVLRRNLNITEYTESFGHHPPRMNCIISKNALFLDVYKNAPMFPCYNDLQNTDTASLPLSQASRQLSNYSATATASAAASPPPSPSPSAAGAITAPATVTVTAPSSSTSIFQLHGQQERWPSIFHPTSPMACP